MKYNYFQVLTIIFCLLYIFSLPSCKKEVPTSPEETSPVFIESASGTTNAQGQATIIFSQSGHTIQVNVKDENSQPLNNIDVDGNLKGSTYLIITADPSKKYFPNITTSYSGSALSMESKSILGIIEVVLEEVDYLTTPLAELEINYPDLIEFSTFHENVCADKDQYSSMLDVSLNLPFIIYCIITSSGHPVVKVALESAKKAIIIDAFPEGKGFRIVKYYTLGKWLTLPIFLIKDPCDPVINWFLARPDNIKKGETSTLKWNTTHAAEVSIEPEIGEVASTGSTVVSPNKTTAYTLKAKNLDKEKRDTETITVSDGEERQHPVAQFSMSSQGKTAYENETLNLTVSPGGTATVSFSAERSYDPDGQIVSYVWKISGTQVSTFRDFTFGLGKGTHQIFLTVKDDDGLESSVGGTVAVIEEGEKQHPVAQFSMSSQGKTAYENETLNLTVSPGGTATVSFSAERSYDPDGQIVSYVWKISGTQVSTFRDFTFGLGKGTHQIFLTVKDDDGLESSVGGTVVVTEGPPEGPKIDYINPTQIIAGTFDLEVYGENFDNGAVDQVYWAEDGHFVGQGKVLSRSITKLVVREYMAGAEGGKYIVKVKNSDGRLSNGVSLFVINPKVDMEPKTGTIGTTLREWGWGFSPNNVAELHFKKPDGTEFPPRNEATDANGKFSLTYTVPEGYPKGTFAFWAIDKATGQKSNTINYTIN